MALSLVYHCGEAAFGLVSARPEPIAGIGDIGDVVAYVA
jgi:hypothetical protein